MTKEIKEMAKDICSFCLKEKGETDCSKDKTSYCFNKRLEEATYAFDLGYRKINEDEIVISKEEYKNFKSEIQKAHHKGVRAGFDMTKFKEYSIRKHTAIEIYEQLQAHGTTYVKKWIKENYGVENNDIVVNKERNKKLIKETAIEFLTIAIQLSDLCQSSYEFKNRLFDFITTHYGIEVETKTIIPEKYGVDLGEK